jgi:hypothetical protein
LRVRAGSPRHWGAPVRARDAAFEVTRYTIPSPSTPTPDTSERWLGVLRQPAELCGFWLNCD